MNNYVKVFLVLGLVKGSKEVPSNIPWAKRAYNLVLERRCLYAITKWSRPSGKLSIQCNFNCI